jgi:hypothetical protein
MGGGSPLGTRHLGHLVIARSHAPWGTARRHRAAARYYDRAIMHHLRSFPAVPDPAGPAGYPTHCPTFRDRSLCALANFQAGAIVLVSPATGDPSVVGATRLQVQAAFRNKSTRDRVVHEVARPRKAGALKRSFENGTLTPLLGRGSQAGDERWKRRGNSIGSGRDR